MAYTLPKSTGGAGGNSVATGTQTASTRPSRAVPAA